MVAFRHRGQGEFHAFELPSPLSHSPPFRPSPPRKRLQKRRAGTCGPSAPSRSAVAATRPPTDINTPPTKPKRSTPALRRAERNSCKWGRLRRRPPPPLYGGRQAVERAASRPPILNSFRWNEIVV